MSFNKQNLSIWILKLSFILFCRYSGTRLKSQHEGDMSKCPYHPMFALSGLKKNVLDICFIIDTKTKAGILTATKPVFFSFLAVTVTSSN